MSSKLRSRLGKSMQIAAIFLCALFAMRGRPPASAQMQVHPSQSVLSVKDAQQDDAISSLRERAAVSEQTLTQRIDQNTATALRQSEDLEHLGIQMADIRGENRAEFGGIALLGGGGMLLGGRKRKREPE